MTMVADDNPTTVTEIGRRLNRLPLGRIHRKVVLAVWSSLAAGDVAASLLFTAENTDDVITYPGVTKAV